MLVRIGLPSSRVERICLHCHRPREWHLAPMLIKTNLVQMVAGATVWLRPLGQQAEAYLDPSPFADTNHLPAALNVPVVAKIKGSISPDLRTGSKSIVDVTMEYCTKVPGGCAGMVAE
jgi:hypothetical protein